jgi:integrase
MLMDFRQQLDAAPRMIWDKASRSVVPSSVMPRPQGNGSRILARLAHIFQAARDRYNDDDAGRILIPRTPFTGIPKPQPAPEGQRNLGTDIVQRIMDAALEGGPHAVALASFVVSFALMGANIADLYRAQPVEPGGVWEYRRKKTETRRADHALMRVEVPPQLAPFLAILGAGTSRRWWLPGLRMGKDSHDKVTRVVNRHLDAWAAEQQLPPFTFYAARHSWASIARAQGVEKATIDDCLCHKGDFAVADIYAERAWHLMAAANDKVLRLFRWPGYDGGNLSSGDRK